MITFLKIAILLVALFLIVYPMLPIKLKWKKLIPIASLKFEKSVRKNLIFVAVAILELILFVVLYKFIEGLGNGLFNIPFIGNLLSGAVNALGSNVKFVAFVVVTIVGNLIMIYAYVFLKSLVKKL